MTPQRNLTIPASKDSKTSLLNTLHSVYYSWSGQFPLACSKGCAACCTQSVAMSTLEGELILDFIRENNREDWLNEQLIKRSVDDKEEHISVNRHARICLERRENVEHGPGSWNFSPCIFLRDDVCTIYDVRPFGCRSFISLERCSGGSGAEVAPIHLTVNTVFTQINEHLCSDGGHWGKMADILLLLVEGDLSGAAENLQPAQAIPGFLLEQREIKVVHDLLLKLYEQSAEKQTFGDLIDNFLSI